MNTLPVSSKPTRTRLIDQTIDAVREFLINGKVPVGEFLPSEEKLSVQFGVGRGTMREAIRTLESQGLVKRVHGRGIQVADQSASASVDMLKLMLQQRKVAGNRMRPPGKFGVGDCGIPVVHCRRVAEALRQRQQFRGPRDRFDFVAHRIP